MVSSGASKGTTHGTAPHGTTRPAAVASHAHVRTRAGDCGRHWLHRGRRSAGVCHGRVSSEGEGVGRCDPGSTSGGYRDKSRALVGTADRRHIESLSTQSRAYLRSCKDHLPGGYVLKLRNEEDSEAGRTHKLLGWIVVERVMGTQFCTRTFVTSSVVSINCFETARGYG